MPDSLVSERREARRATRSPHVVPALVLAAVTAVTLWPAVVHFRTQALVDRLDGSVFTWAWWAMPRAIARGEDPFRTDQLFHPVGADIALTTTAPLVGAITWPVRALLGPEAQINLVQLAAGFLAALGAYLLAHRVCARRGPSVVAGVAFALTSHRLVHVPGHLNLIHSWVIPFGCLLLLRFVDSRTLGLAAALGGFAGVTFLVDPQLALLLAVALVPLVVLHRRELRRQVGALAVAGGAAVIVAMPLLAPMVRAISNEEMNPPPAVDESIVYSASPLSWVVPGPDHAALGALVDDRQPGLTTEGVVYPGVLVLVLAVAAVRLVNRERRRGWTAMAVTGIVLSLGPSLLLYDTVIDLPLPYRLISALPGLDLQRVPGRFALVAVTGLVVLAACSLSALVERNRSRERAIVWGALLITLLDLLPTGLPQRPASVPEPYEVIAAQSGDGAVLEIPIQWYTGEHVVGDNTDFSFLLHAIVHERPVVSGGVSRLPDRRLDQLLDIRLYREVLALQGAAGFDEAATFDARDLDDLGIRWVALDRRRATSAALDHLERLDLTVLADDGEVIVWEVAP